MSLQIDRGDEGGVLGRQNSLLGWSSGAFFVFSLLTLLITSLTFSRQTQANDIGDRKCVSDKNQDADLSHVDKVRAGATLFQVRGCIACHEADSPYLKWTPGKLGPELLKIRSKLNRQWLVSWIHNPKLVHSRTLMPEYGVKGRGLTHEEASAIASYLLDSSSSLSYSPQALVYDRTYQPTRASIETGKQIFQTRGCLGCHDLGKEKAPGPRHLSLEGAGLKLAPAWLYTWIENPRQVSPSTIMPQFSLKPAEIGCLCDFIMSLNQPEMKYPLLVSDWGTPAQLKEDKQRAVKSGCYSCHEISWLEQSSPKELIEAQLPYAVDLAEFILGPEKATRTAIDNGKKLISKYGCYSCHLIPGFKASGKQFGPDLREFAGKDARLLSLEGYDWSSWTRNKLKNPRCFDSAKRITVMPDFHLNADEIEQLTAFLKTQSLSKELPAADPKQGEPAVGEAIMNHYGCTGCHSMYDEHKFQYAAFHKEALVKFGKIAPNLSPEGARVNSQWLADYLRSPYKMRPYLPATMPSFNLPDSDCRALIGYFRASAKTEPAPFKNQDPNAKLRLEGKKLLEQYKCIACHKIAGKEVPSTNPLIWYKNMSEARRFAPDLRFAEQRLSAPWESRFIETPHLFIPDTTMPYLALTAEQIQKIRSYLSSLVPYSRSKSKKVGN